MKRALLLVLVLLGVAAPVEAQDFYRYQYRPSTFGGWVDTNCDGDHGFEVVIYSDANGGGAKTKICAAEDNFCDVPLANKAEITGCFLLYPADTANDRVSSYKLNYLSGGNQGTAGYCLFMYQNAYYDTWVVGQFNVPSGIQGLNLGANDAISSVRRHLCANP